MKLFRAFSVAAAASLSLAAVSCSQRTDVGNVSRPWSGAEGAVAAEDGGSGGIVFDEESFFTPDYTPCEIEEESPAGKIPPTGSGYSGGKAAGIVPGLRKLSEYKTAYGAGRQVVSLPAIARAAAPSKATDGPFTVADWGPRSVLPEGTRLPSFYVLFSEPVVPLSDVGRQCDGSGYFSVTPEIRGVFRWNGTRLLSFDCTESASPGQTYTITVGGNVRSAGGKTLEGGRVFVTEAAPLRIIWSAPGYSKSRRVDMSEVPPECAQEWRVQFNYPVDARRIGGMSSITVREDGQEDGKAVLFEVRQELDDTVTYSWRQRTPFGATVALTVTQGAGGGSGAKAEFRTLSPFRYESAWSGSTHGRYANPVNISFSHQIDRDSAPGAVSALKKSGERMAVTEDNIEVRGGTLVVYGLPVEFHSHYRIEISGGLKDIYGRSLGVETPVTVEVDVPGAESMARFTDSGAKMLESRFPHKMVFEYQNIEEGAYTLSATDSPFLAADYNLDVLPLVRSPEAAPHRTALSAKPRDERLLEVVDFDSLLHDGKGWVSFMAAVRLPKKATRRDSGKSYWVTNKTSVQVTNLGVTARYAMNKVVVLVTNLSDGKPVADAEVYAIGTEDADYKSLKERAARTGTSARTDSGGLAVISLRDKDSRESVLSSDYYNTPYIIVEKDGDKVMLRPDDHSPWRSGIYSYSNVPNKVEAVPRIFMFSDRGLYRPGETVSFRGIDRSQILGSFVPHADAGYTVTLRDSSWRDAKEYAAASGVTSESGGFYGSLTLPGDIEPGAYVLEYRHGDESHRLGVTVAYFERLRFQSSVAMPSAPVTAGEKIQATLSAGYLAGGSLAQAAYKAGWFREPWYFSSDSPELSKYKFGPADSRENRSHISSDEGVLDALGNAVLTCETGGNPVKGAPYRYRVSADVTDVSNQQISAAGVTLVHPAGYYIGLSEPEMRGPFARKGEKVTFTYRLASPEGDALSERAVRPLAGGSRLVVRLTREEWSLVQQQGISDIYSRYEKTDVTESEQTVSLGAGGKITVTPKEPGYHKIHLAAKDAQGRDVITEREFFVTGSGSVSWYQDDAASLRLTPDKNQYNPGETAHILLESALPEGNYLITVEREGIFTEEVRHLDGQIHVLDIPVARNFVPVFYVSVSSYSVRHGEPSHGYGEVDLDKPKGFYGATAVFVNPRVKSFTVRMEGKPSYRPGEEAEITLTATKGGKPLAGAELTLLAVDRGVLDLTDYHVPDPLSFYYSAGNFPLRVRGGDSRAYLMNPVTYEVKNLRGGDSDDDKLHERGDFNPTAVFEPMLRTGEDGKVSVRFKLPDTLTTYRLTVFGVSGELLALQEDEIAVRNPVNVQQVLPRQLRERDTAEAGVLLTNLDGAAHEVTVSIAVPESAAREDDSGVTRGAGKAFVDGTDTRTLTVPAGASAAVYFDVAAQKAGAVTIEFTVRSDVLGERIVCPLIIERPHIFETVTTTGRLSADENSAQERVVIPGLSNGADDMDGSLSVTLDATRMGILGGAVRYLFDYPYGCMEQQSSRVLPLVAFGEYIDVFGLDNKVTDVKKCVISHFRKWKSVQHADGGFGYWETSRQTDLFVSARVAHIYALAVGRGYSAEELALDIGALCAYIERETLALEKDAGRLLARQAASPDGRTAVSLYHNDYNRAYNYYVLALNGRGRAVPDEKLRALTGRERQDTAVIALAGLASLAKDGKSARTAKDAAAKIRTLISPTARGADIKNPSARYEEAGYYGDQAESLALALQLLTQIDSGDEMNARLLFSLLEGQRAGCWRNTATTARVLDAIRTVIKTDSLDSTSLTAKAILGGEGIADGGFKGAAARPVTVTLPFNSDALRKLPRDTEIPLDISKKGAGSLYYTATMRYALPEEMRQPRDEGLGIVMRIFDNATGEEIRAGGGDDDAPVCLESGRTYKARVTLSSAYDRRHIALRVSVPSGAEILDAAFVTTADDGTDADGRDDDDFHGRPFGGGHYMSSQAIYDSEIQFFYDSFGRGVAEAEFKFRAVRRGVFPTPPVTAECMYEPEVFGRTGGVLYTIR